MANEQNTKKRMILNAFDMNCVVHQNPGMWAHPDDQSHRYKDVDYWTDLAKLLERGGFDCLFIADVLGFYDVYGGSRDTALRTAAQAPVGDPAIPVAAMAAVTERLGFGVTKSLTYELPYSFAKTMTTLDHITKGRVAWNIVTSYQASAAENLGLVKQIPHDERYAVADEFMEVCYKLWEGSWEDDAVVRDKKNRIFTDPSKVHSINHEGKYYKVPGAHLGEPSPQRTPFLFQAGTSKKGMEFAGKHAEAVFVIGTSPEELRPTVDKLRQQAAAAGRDPRSVKIIVMLTPITAPTDEEAQAKLEDFNQYVDMDAALTLFGGWTGIDMSSAAADQPLESMESDAIRAMIEMLTGVDSEIVWTKERLAKWLCIGGFSASVVGSPKTIVDEMERWMEIADVDGFNLGRVIAPGTMKDFVDLVVPELRKRGHVPQEPLAPMTMRERLTGDSRLPSEHAGASYRVGAEASVSR
ncbi:LLM class flavin-dependent oxidoreductase [Arthrobacter methylotrophus]|uniref:LLM class flavin-dependent oxidoreductase n=1 Tax=Arthrobacter methylotrophus TaxID=121291 RepID=A0ABV5UW99_9MICC